MNSILLEENEQLILYCFTRSLTQIMIRDQYMRHIGVTSMDDQNISLLRQIVEILLLEMVCTWGAKILSNIQTYRLCQIVKFTSFVIIRISQSVKNL